MPTFRESLWPIVAITIAAAIVMLLIAPLEATEWANGFRGGVTAVGNEGFEAGTGGITMIIGPLIKVTLLMGVPALITLGARNLIGQARRN